MKSSRSWITAALLLVLTLFAGSTFGTLLVGLACFSMTSLLVWLRLRDFEHVSSKRADDAADSAGTRSRAGLPAWLAAICCGVLVVVVAGTAATWRVGSYSGDNVVPMVIAADTIAHAALMLCLVIWAIRLQRGHVALLPLGLTVVVLTMAGGGVTSTVVAQTTVALAGCAGFLLASQSILSGHSFAFQDRSSRRSLPPIFGDRANLLYSALALSIILMVTSVLTKATSDVLPDAQEMVATYLTDSLEVDAGRQIASSTRYVTGSRLGSVRAHMLGDPMAVALRGYSDLEPGYLRGTVFELYDSKNWVNLDASGERIPRSQTGVYRVTPESRARTPINGESEGTRRRFVLPLASPGPIRTLELHGEPSKGTIAFSPLTSRWVETTSGGLRVSDSGIIIRGVRISQPYVFGVTRSLAADRLPASRQQQLLRVPADVEPVAKPLAETICAGLSNSRDKAAAIETFFATNFTYSLKPPRAPRYVDPVSHFLATRHDGHCEFFATGAAMLLRCAGVPARYVTGYVMDELSDENPYWISRNRDAHAWVEAYDDSTEVWFPVEATPGRSYRTIAFADDEEELAEVDSSQVNLAAEGPANWYQQLWLAMISFRVTDLLEVLFWLAQLPLFFGLAAYLLWRHLRKSKSDEDLADARSRRMLRQVDRRIRRYKLKRNPHETLHQFAERLERNAAERNVADADQFLEQAARWYRTYATARYRGLEPTPIG